MDTRLFILSSQLIFPVIAFLVCVQAATAGPLDDGKAAYKNGQYQTAFNHFLEAANKGNSEAMYRLGKWHYGGKGGWNYAKAKKWYTHAAKLGHAEAMSSLGGMYLGGNGVQQSETEAYKWYRRAAETGDVYSMMLVGVHYYADGTQFGKVEALRWFRKAAENGDSVGMWYLGAALVRGKYILQHFVPT